MKQLSMDLKGGPDGLSDQEFQKKYKMSKQEARKELTSNRKDNTKPQPVSEAHLEEDDIIVIPGQGRKMKTGFVPHGQSRVDHEVEMARSDLFSAAQNAQKVHAMIKHVSEDEGLEGWVQEKIIKANDYLNTIREYLEGKQVQGVAEAVGSEEQMAEQTLQKLISFARDNPETTLAQLASSPLKNRVTAALSACDLLIRSYTNAKQLGNAEFVRQLKQEINYFLTEKSSSSDLLTFGDLLMGKLGKINFQQGVAEGKAK
jgi:hypothetical protein